jgi:hypothetical protein
MAEENYTKKILERREFGKNYYHFYSDKSKYSRDISGVQFKDITDRPKKDIYVMQTRFDSEESKNEFVAHLTPDQRYYRDNGYIIKKKFVKSDLIDELKELRVALGLNDRQSFPDYVPYINYETIKKICCSGEMSELLRELHGEYLGIRFNLSPMVSTQRGWHQDCYLDDETSIPRCAIWIALDDVPLESGPFEYIPGSHRWQSLSRSKINAYIREDLRWPANHPNWSSISEAFVDPACFDEIERRGDNIVPFLGKKGDVLVWYGRLMHRGAPPANDSSIRPGLIAHFASVQQITNQNKTGCFLKYGKNGGYYYVPDSRAKDFPPVPEADTT